MTDEERMQAIEHALKSTFDVTYLEIIDDSHLHVGHASHGGAGHFTLRLVSDDFEGINRVKRHQLIYNALTELMSTEIHALAIDAKTTTEQRK